MTTPPPERYIRPLSEVRQILVRRALAGRNPFTFVDPRRIHRILASLSSLDRDAWAEAFMSAGREVEAEARKAESAGNAAGAAKLWLTAYGYHRVARYPTTNSPKKREAYDRYRRCFLNASRAFNPPMQRVEMPLQPAAGQAPAAVGYLRRPSERDTPVGVVVTWGGIDTFKEDLPLRSEPYLQMGLATLAIDMPGVGEAPVRGCDDVGPMWDAVFSWIDGRADLDGDRVAVLARSTGGYWATWLAHTRRERLRAAVNHAGPVHHAFTVRWIEQAQHGEYPLELAESLAAAWGKATYEDWIAYAPKVSLLTQGLLDAPCAPLLCVNGVDDSVFPIADHHLLLKHGDPKSARFFPGGHMGWTPETEPTIARWLRARLLAGA